MAEIDGTIFEFGEDCTWCNNVKNDPNIPNYIQCQLLNNIQIEYSPFYESKIHKGGIAHYRINTNTITVDGKVYGVDLQVYTNGGYKDLTYAGHYIRATVNNYDIYVTPQTNTRLEFTVGCEYVDIYTCNYRPKRRGKCKKIINIDSVSAEPLRHPDVNKMAVYIDKKNNLIRYENYSVNNKDELLIIYDGPGGNTTIFTLPSNKTIKFDVEELNNFIAWSSPHHVLNRALYSYFSQYRYISVLGYEGSNNMPARFFRCDLSEFSGVFWGNLCPTIERDLARAERRKEIPETE